MLRCVALALVLASCAQLSETVTLRAVPMESPRVVNTPAGERLAIRGARSELSVTAVVTKQRLCRDVQEQRAEGFRRVERRAVGPSLTLEWLFGGLLTAGGAGLVTWTALSPEDPTFGPTGASTNYAYGVVIGAAGLALLGGAAWDWHKTGVHEESLGVQTLKKQGLETVCAEEPAPGGQVRLTLADGLQLEAEVDATGTAQIPLPADVDLRLEREGSRRATLEAKGDARAQVRITL